MCGRFKLIDSPEIQWLCEPLGISLHGRHRSRDIAPGSTIAIVHQRNGERRASEAIWWLLLDPKFIEVEEFESLLQPKVIKPMKVTRTGKPSKWDSLEESFMIVT